MTTDNHNFRNYVQSVAFSMTLSRAMIEALGLFRDFGSCLTQNTDGRASRHINSYSVPIFRSLERRGLVWHDYIEPMKCPKEHRYIKLTRAGELMCELLVEAGMLSEPQTVRAVANGGKRRAA